MCHLLKAVLSRDAIAEITAKIRVPHNCATFILGGESERLKCVGSPLYPGSWQRPFRKRITVPMLDQPCELFSHAQIPPSTAAKNFCNCLINSLFPRRTPTAIVVSNANGRFSGRSSHARSMASRISLTPAQSDEHIPLAARRSDSASPWFNHRSLFRSLNFGFARPE